MTVTPSHHKAKARAAACKARGALDRAAEHNKVTRMSSGDACFYAKQETKIAPTAPAVAPADTDDVHSDVFDEKVSSRAPAIVIID